MSGEQPLPEPLKKDLRAYLARASELDAVPDMRECKIVAYYCRQYAVQLGIPLSKQHSSDPSVRSFVIGLLTAWIRIRLP